MSERIYSKNPWKKLLSNIIGCQNRNERSTDKGIKRKTSKIEVDDDDLEKIFKMQEGRSYWLNYPLDPMDVFVPYNLLSPSVDRINSYGDYTLGNICICSRFENFAFGQSDLEQRKKIMYFMQNNIGYIMNIDFDKFDKILIPSTYNSIDNFLVK